MSIKGPDEARTVAGMKEDFILHARKEDPLCQQGNQHRKDNEDPRATNFRNKEPVARTQGRGSTPPLTARALLGTPTGGLYPDPGY